MPTWNHFSQSVQHASCQTFEIRLRFQCVFSQNKLSSTSESNCHLQSTSTTTIYNSSLPAAMQTVLSPHKPYRSPGCHRNSFFLRSNWSICPSTEGQIHWLPLVTGQTMTHSQPPECASEQISISITTWSFWCCSPSMTSYRNPHRQSRSLDSLSRKHPQTAAETWMQVSPQNGYGNMNAVFSKFPVLGN